MSKSMTTNGIEELSYSIGSSIINATFTVTVDVTDANGHTSTARTSAQIYVNGWNMSFTELEETPLIDEPTPTPTPTPTPEPTPEPTASPALALKGDATNDGTVDILDLVSIIDYIVSNTDPTSLTNTDANGDDKVDILDLVWVIDQIVGG